MYSYKKIVSYSECNDKKVARLSTTLDFLQDASTFQSEELGVGVDYLWANNSAWVLASWQIDIDRLPSFGEEIEIITNPYSIKGYMGGRNFMIADESGKYFVKANTNWVYVALDTGRPKRVDEDMAKAYAMGEPIEMEYLDRKFLLPEDLEEKNAIEVPHYFIDTNHHVNNTKYILVAEEYLPEDAEVYRVQAEYKNPAKLGATFVPFVKLTEDRLYASIRNPQGEVYVNVVFWLR